MPDEEWRDEIQEYALLLDAVASGDRSRVVKHSTDYILGKKEGNHASQSNNGETQEEQDQYYNQDEDGYEYYGEHEGVYNNLHAGTSTQFTDQEGIYPREEKAPGYEEGQYQYDNGYDESAPADYDASAATEDYYEGPYMSGAYNEPDNGADTYVGEPYDNYNPSAYENEPYETGVTEIADESYPVGTYDGTSNNYERHSYPEDQQYNEGYYGQEADGVYNDWNYEQGEGEGGEWHEESGYGLVSDDQIQEVVDEVNLHEPDEVYPEEDQMHSHGHHAHSEGQPYPEDDVLPNHHQDHAQQDQPYPEDDFFSYDTTKDAPPEYSEIPRYEINPSQQTHYLPYRPHLTTPETTRAVNGTNISMQASINSHADRFHSRTDVNVAGDEEDEWEDEICEDEDDGIRYPPSPYRSDLQFNPLSHQYERNASSERSVPFIYMPAVQSNQSKVTWGIYRH